MRFGLEDEPVSEHLQREVMALGPLTGSEVAVRYFACRKRPVSVIQ